MATMFKEMHSSIQGQCVGLTGGTPDTLHRTLSELLCLFVCYLKKDMFTFCWVNSATIESKQNLGYVGRHVEVTI